MRISTLKQREKNCSFLLVFSHYSARLKIFCIITTQTPLSFLFFFESICLFLIINGRWAQKVGNEAPLLQRSSPYFGAGRLAVVVAAAAAVAVVTAVGVAMAVVAV